MDLGQLIFILSRLILGAVASFLAIMVWSRTRDIAWMFLIIGVIAAYVETIYGILKFFGIVTGDLFVIGSMPLISIILPNLPVVFFIIAFAVMVSRKYRRS